MYDRDLLGEARVITNLKRTIFVKNLPKNVFHEDLDKLFSRFGKIKSVKVSQTPTYKVDKVKKTIDVDFAKPMISNGFGFVTFEEEKSVADALS